ncbi:MAG: polyphenol oxidase family protein [Solirubrobacterales bacterium]
MKWRSDTGVEWLEAELPGATVAFTTRRGGVSESPFDQLNLGILTEDRRGDVIENRKRLAAALGIQGGRVAMARQVHGSRIVTHNESEVPPHFLAPGDPPADADGHITIESGLPMLVLVADFLPVALKGPGGLAMLHCGWRGLTGGMIDEAAARTGATHAAIGPAIGPCCFEVGEEVFEEFGELATGLRVGNHLDLWQLAERRLGQAGVANIEVAGICTFCEEGKFFSHRRDHGRTGRQSGIAWIH